MSLDYKYISLNNKLREIDEDYQIAINNKMVIIEASFEAKKYVEEVGTTINLLQQGLHSNDYYRIRDELIQSIDYFEMDLAKVESLSTENIKNLQKEIEYTNQQLDQIKNGMEGKNA